jgi:cell shape-determining protein MreC
MIYIERNKKRWFQNIYLWIVVFVVAVIVAVNIFFPHLVPALANSVASPFWRLEFAVKNGSLDTVEKLLNENAELKRAIEENSSNAEMIAYVQKENDELRDMLGASSTINFVVAPIIKRPPSIAYDEFIIDAGLDQGVSTSSIIYVAGDVPLGKVINVFAKTSRVLLFSSPNVKHDVQIGPSYVGATATGRGGGQYEVELPRGLNVSVDDFVTAFDLGQKPLGKIIHIDSDPSLTFEKVIFSAPVNIYELKWVKVSIHK